jgi:hypothetical protein
MRSTSGFRLFAAGLTVACVAGCSDPASDRDATPAGDTWEQETNFTDALGGYTFDDEAEAFGDPALQAIEIAERAVSGGDPDSLPADSTGAAFAVRIVWGQLEGNRNATRLLDWSGSLQSSPGTLTVLRIVAFERLHGDRVLPRTDRHVVAFESHTQPSFDGLVLLVRPADPLAPGELTLSTGPLTHTWTYDELRGGEQVIRVDDAGNAVSIAGVRLAPPADDLCARGFVRGHWQHRDDARGILRGVWVAANGIAVGHIRGHFGLTPAGDRVWFGKIVGRGGRFLGIARGTYLPNDDPLQPGGTFAGRIVVRPNIEAGAVAGHYLPGRPRAHSGDPHHGRPGAAGFFEGRWVIGCTDPE